MSDLIYLVANGDLRLSANRNCWDAQQKAEHAIMEAIRREGRQIERAHPYDEARGHGFIDSQKYGNQRTGNVAISSRGCTRKRSPGGATVAPRKTRATGSARHGQNATRPSPSMTRPCEVRVTRRASLVR